MKVIQDNLWIIYGYQKKSHPNSVEFDRSCGRARPVTDSGASPQALLTQGQAQLAGLRPRVSDGTACVRSSNHFSQIWWKFPGNPDIVSHCHFGPLKGEMSYWRDTSFDDYMSIVSDWIITSTVKMRSFQLKSC